MSHPSSYDEVRFAEIRRGIEARLKHTCYVEDGIEVGNEDCDACCALSDLHMSLLPICNDPDCEVCRDNYGSPENTLKKWAWMVEGVDDRALILARLFELESRRLKESVKDHARKGIDPDDVEKYTKFIFPLVHKVFPDAS